MKLRRVIRTAFRSLRGNPLRTSLTALGMVIGVAAVVAVLAIGEGARANVESSIRSLGANLLTVRPGSGQSGGVRSGTTATLTEADARALESLDGVRAVSPQMSGSAQIRYLENNLNASVLGINGSYLEITSLDIGRGVGITETDERDRERVALIGANVADTLFGAVNPVGERLQIKGVGFRVIGVLAPKGDVGFQSPDDLVLVPLSTHRGVLFGGDSLSTISVQVENEDESAPVQARIEQLLRLRHNLAPEAEDDFRVRSQAEMLATMTSVADTFTALLGCVAAVSLVVGGIGIMNIMLVSVRERTREIGVRIAIGARRRDVLLQFLVEAVVVSLAGGGVGLLLGYASAFVLARVGGWQTVVPLYSVVLSGVVSVAVGIVFGVGPARHASRLDPVEALRQE